MLTLNGNLECSEPRLRLDLGHEPRTSREMADRRHKHGGRKRAAAGLRVLGSEVSDRSGRPQERVLRRFRASLHTLTCIARDPLVWHTEDDAVLSDLRETLDLTETALRQFESARNSKSNYLLPSEAILTIANLVEDRMDRLFERMERMTALQQSLFRLGGILESVAKNQVPRVHEIEELTAIVLDVTIHDGGRVTLLDPDSADAALRIAAHGINVAQVAVCLATHVPTWHQELSLAVSASLLMDVGMMRVPAEVLESTDLLSAPQRILLERHPEQSAAIVEQMEGTDERWVEAVRQHHERLDGSGYPSHARGSAVGSVARLLAVADYYVGLQSPRVYRPALSGRQALVEINRAVVEGRLDPAWSCRLPEIETQWLKIPTAPEPPSGAPACSAKAA